MVHYLVRRVLISIATLIMISFLIYALIRHMPGTPLTVDPSMMDPSKQLSEAEIVRLERLYGLDKTVVRGLFRVAAERVAVRSGPLDQPE